MKAWTGAIALLLTAAAPAAPAMAQDTTLYRGGPIITMDGDTPRTVEAVVTRSDRIAFAGTEKEARKAAGKDAAIRDLAGATMLPGFIDAHSHFSVATMSAGGLDLRDKAHAGITDIAGLQRAIGDHIAAAAIPPGGWVVVWQYDQENLAEKRHITRAELDAVAADRPVVVLHVSLHGLVANSAALAARDRLKIDLALLPFSTGLDALLANPALTFGTYQGHVKLQGIKFVLDGSVQARTGYFTRDYKRGSPEGSHPWHGEPVLLEEEFIAQARKAHNRGWQLFVHANGDAAIDMAIRGFDALGIKAAGDRRPVVIHSQFQRRDQLPAYARIGVGPAYFSNHAWYWGDVHRTNFPAEVVDFISPFRSARAAGLIPSNHSDYSVTPLDTRFMLWTSMARTSPTGIVSGADERIDAYAALQALTTGPAWQIFEEDRKGRIKPGLLADFVILDRNPLTAPVDAIKDIRVLAVVKEAKTVWQAAPR